MKQTAIIGASPNPERYSFIAAQMMHELDYPFIPIGIKKGIVLGVNILDLKQKPLLQDIDTITLYMGAKNQLEWTEYILSLAPKRIIFNPGAENFAFQEMANKAGIETLNACTLVMLRTGQY